jgi:hypothetical protein
VSSVRQAGNPRGLPRGGALVWLLLVLLLALALGLVLWAGLQHLIAWWGEVPVNITIDGERVVEGLRLDLLDTGTRIGFVVSAVVVIMVLALLLPLLLALVVSGVLLAAAVAVFLALGAPAIAVASAVLAIGLFIVAPIVLLGRLMRRRRRPVAGSGSASVLSHK